MISSCPNVKANECFPIGKAAEILGINRSTLRVAADNGYIMCRFNSINHRRVFTGSDLKLYWQKVMGIV